MSLARAAMYRLLLCDMVKEVVLADAVVSPGTSQSALSFCGCRLQSSACLGDRTQSSVVGRWQVRWLCAHTLTDKVHQLLRCLWEHPAHQVYQSAEPQQNGIIKFHKLAGQHKIAASKEPAWLTRRSKQHYGQLATHSSRLHPDIWQSASCLAAT